MSTTLLSPLVGAGGLRGVVSFKSMFSCVNSFTRELATMEQWQVDDLQFLPVVFPLCPS